MAAEYPFHDEVRGHLALLPAEAFDRLDDHRRLAAHMNAASWMMVGTSMTTTLDALQGKAVGSHIRMAGRIFGIPLHLDEVVITRQPPRCKVWETVGEPRLLVMGGYCMGFELAPAAGGSTVTIAIDYAWPRHGAARWLGRALAGIYARWCIGEMLRAARGP